MTLQCGFDVSQFDPITSNFHLRVIAAQILDRAVTAETTQVLTSTASDVNVAAQAVASSGAPKLTIETPVADARFAAASTIHFMATAKDYSGTDLTARIVWSSNVDGALGTGGSITKTLTSGTHVISARVTDRRGRTGTVWVTIVVE